MNPNSRYWERRLAEDMFDEMSKVETSFADIAKLFTQALLYMQAQAEDIFEKYRDKHGLSDEEARELLHRMNDPANLKEMQERLRNTADSAEKKELVRKLEAPAYQERIRRAEELRKNINTIMEDLAAKEEEKGEEILKEAADDGYYEAIYRTQQRADAGFSFSELNPELVDEAIHTNFNGKEFSERVWGNTGKLAEVLKEELAVGILTQRAERETALAIAQRMGKGLVEARRLVRTESNRLYTEFAMKGLEEAGIEKYMFLATLDLRTSKMCREHDGKIYKVKERKTGDNCPPLHPWCRSTVMGIISEALLSKLNRDALDPETGKRIKVPLSMTYAEWHKKYVKGRGQDMAEKEKQPQSRNLTREQYERYRRRGVGPDSYEEFIKIKGAPEAWAKLQEEYRKAKEVPKKSKKKKAVHPKVEDKAAEVVVESEKVEGENIYQDQTINAANDVANTNSEDVPSTEQDNWPEDIIITNTWEDDGEFRQGYEDITEEALTDVAPNTNPVEDITDFAQDGRRYTVDGVNVKLEYEPKEKQTAELLQRKLGVTVQMMPKVNGDYKHVETPDYLVDGERWDRKGVEGNSPKYVYNTIHKKKQQAETFVLCMTDRTSLQLQEVIRQAQEVFFNYHTRFVRQIIVVDKNGNIVRILKRK